MTLKSFPGRLLALESDMHKVAHPRLFLIMAAAIAIREKVHLYNVARMIAKECVDLLLGDGVNIAQMTEEECGCRRGIRRRRTTRRWCRCRQ